MLIRAAKKSAGQAGEQVRVRSFGVMIFYKSGE